MNDDQLKRILSVLSTAVNGYYAGYNFKDEEEELFVKRAWIDGARWTLNVVNEELIRAKKNEIRSNFGGGNNTFNPN